MAGENVETIDVVYVGPHDSVLVPELGAEAIMPGKPVKVPAELGQRLLRQEGNWAAAPKGRGAGTAPAATEGRSPESTPDAGDGEE